MASTAMTHSRVVPFSVVVISAKRVFQHSIIGTHIVYIRQQDQKILLKPIKEHGPIKVIAVTLYTVEGAWRTVKSLV